MAGSYEPLRESKAHPSDDPQRPLIAASHVCGNILRNMSAARCCGRCSFCAAAPLGGHERAMVMGTQRMRRDGISSRRVMALEKSVAL
jgi:hypothetical protein